MAERFSSAVIYDAVIDDDCFAALPTLLAAHFGARSALLGWHNKARGADLLADSGYFSRDHLDTYATQFAMEDPWLHASENPAMQNRAINLERLVPVPVYEKSFFYNEFIREIGDDSVRAMGVRTQNRFGIGLVALHRGKQQEGFLDDDVAALDREARHLRRMLAIRSRFEAQGRHSATLEAVLDSMRDAALLVGPDQMVSYVNHAADAMLRRGDLLALQQRRLSTAGRASHTRLQAAIAAACDAGAPTAGAVLLDRRDGRSAVATLTPFKLPHGRREALLLTHDDDGAANELGPQLQRLFRLTRSEAEIAVRIGDGLSVAEIAAERQVGGETIRSQVKALMAKLGCRRQSEVVALVKTIPLPPTGELNVRI